MAFELYMAVHSMPARSEQNLNKRKSEHDGLMENDKPSLILLVSQLRRLCCDSACDGATIENS